MQVAASPFSTSIHPQYHPYYQLHAPGPQDHELKRQYLTLLPPAQIIEICLAFDAYVPPYAKTTIWPPDFNAAIAALQKAASDAATSLKEREKENIATSSKVSGNAPAVMDCLKSPEPPERSASQSQNTSASKSLATSEIAEPTVAPALGPDSSTTASQPATDKPAAPNAQPDSGASGTSDGQQNTSTSGSASTSTTTQTAAQLQPSAQPVEPAPPTPTQPPYPHQPFGYGHPPGAYPHTPYYTSGYPYPYAYAAAMQNGYHLQPPPQPPQPASYPPPQPQSYGAMPPPPHPHVPPHPEGMGTDDLPSYEEMIVEALTECGDPEGWAPKDLFTWMSARYPLQSNFRPSASQALQKAFKRGRFEKSSNGKYRLSASWEGGSTSRRTTRRPQTLNGSNAHSSSMPPFTNAPLIHPHGRALAAQSLFTKQPMNFSQYSGRNATQNRASTSTAPGTAAGAQAAVGAPSTADRPPGPSTENAAAYETAQSILKAINFPSLLKIYEEGKEGTSSAQPLPQLRPQVGDGVEHLLSHVQAVLAGGTPPVPAATSTIAQPLPQVVAENKLDPRAELQAQLALLSAQLAELAKFEELEGVAQPAQQPSPVAHTLPAPAPTPIAGRADVPVAGPSMHSLLMPSQAAMAVISSSNSPAVATSGPSLPQAEESDNDDDMEEII